MVGSWESFEIFNHRNPFHHPKMQKITPGLSCPYTGSGVAHFWATARTAYGLVGSCWKIVPRTDSLPPKNRPPKRGVSSSSHQVSRDLLVLRKVIGNKGPSKRNISRPGIFLCWQGVFVFREQFGHQNGWMIFVFPYSALTFGQNFLRNFFLRRNHGWSGRQIVLFDTTLFTK